MKKFEVAWAFSEMADLLEIQGAEAYKVRAYRKAAQTLANLSRDLEQMAAEDRLEEIPGVGKALAAKIKEILSTGTLRHLEELREKIPPDLVRLLEIPGVGPRTAALVYRQLNIRTLAELEDAARAQKLRYLPGVGAKKEQQILHGIEILKNRGGRSLLGTALPWAREFLRLLRSHPGVGGAEVAGSVRRRQETVGDLDLVVSSAEPERVVDFFLRLPPVRQELERGQSGASALAAAGLRVDLQVVPPCEFVARLHRATGSREHLARLEQLAAEKGLQLAGEGFVDGKGQPRAFPGEEALYRELGLSYIPPELRENRGEIEAASRGELPSLVTRGDLRGDLHTHTTWSDGISGLEEMVSSARALGYEYLAITDHSRSLAVARGLDEERLAAQKARIEELNRELEDIRLLSGVEVDILPDGRLDLRDEVLAELDVVVASIHSGFRQDPQVLTSRLEGAIKNEHVDIVAHPTGRLLGRREPYGVDLDRILDLAREMNTALEINASPDRLDLNDRQARRARERGVTVAINTDAHSTAGLEDMEYGVSVARRGWLEPGDILNCLPLKDLLRRLRR